MGGRRYTKEQLLWIESNLNSYQTYIDMAKDFNSIFSESRTDQAISNTATKRLKLNKKFNSGQYSEKNKKEELPLGSIRDCGNGTTYIKVKLVGNQRPKITGYQEPYWKPIQKKIYEDAYGEIKGNEMVIFLDCDNKNYSLENLYCIDRRISAIVAKNKWYSKNPDITLNGIMYAKLILKLSEEKEGR